MGRIVERQVQQDTRRQHESEKKKDTVRKTCRGEAGSWNVVGPLAIWGNPEAKKADLPPQRETRMRVAEKAVPALDDDNCLRARPGKVETAMRLRHEESGSRHASANTRSEGQGLDAGDEEMSARAAARENEESQNEWQLVSRPAGDAVTRQFEPAISYEKFVEDLDPRDSFTTTSTLTELLVRGADKSGLPEKKMAVSDKARGLCNLAVPQRVYRNRGVAVRRPLNLADYLSVPPDEMGLDDDNDSLESLIDPSGPIEGARMNFDLYDAHPIPALRHQPRRSPAVTDFTSHRRSSGREGNNVGPSAASVPPRRLFPSRLPELPWSPAPESATPSTAGSRMGTGTPAVQSSRSDPAPQVDARSERAFLSWLPRKRAPLAPATACGRSAQPRSCAPTAELSGSGNENESARFRDERDWRPLLPRRESPPARVPWGDRERGGEG
ncbi:hypothetical protein BC826DRAFT_969914 [Russula brevipes]|nr:hypothetical protein BC826DRAFT_969914 [Russula brevipes]